jgi:predicted outer membrane repeat protein
MDRGSGLAATIHVPGMEPTLQAGINAAAPGDTVLVAPGTYAGPANRDLDFGGKTIVLRSSNGSAATVIDAQDQGRGFDFHSGEPAQARVEGFTIRNGSVGLYPGGGMRCIGAAPTLRDLVFESCDAIEGGGGYFEQSAAALEDCAFTSCTAANSGGGLNCLNAGLTLARATVTACTAGSGAGIYIRGPASPALLDCIVEDNPALNLGGGLYSTNASMLSLRRTRFARNSGRHGGGIHVFASAGQVDSCVFAANSAIIRGGGLYWESGTSVELAHCDFAGNVVTTGSQGFAGGGAGAYILDLGTIEITACDFSENAGRELAGLGAGLFLRNSTSATVSGASFTHNSSARSGGGLWGSGVPVTMTDCVFTDNRANAGGGGGLSSSHPLAITSCTFTGNRATTTGGGVAANVVEIHDSEFTDNSATSMGGAIIAGASPAIAGCTFTHNSASSGGALSLWTGSFSLSGCTFAENSALFGAGLFADDATVAATECTFARNAGSFGAGFAFTDSSTAAVSNTIVALSTSGEAIYCENDASIPVLSCTDLFANPGGDWTACIADQLGINGCFSADPLFCHWLAGDYTLAEGSPCAPAHSPAGCGLIGAHPVGCQAPIGMADAGAPARAPRLLVNPNPVHGAAMVEWTGAGDSRALALRVFDAAGRLKAHRALRELSPAGRVPWRDVVGPEGLPAGVYFLEMSGTRTPGVMSRTRIVVLR